jgi:hypothetical protein
MSSKVVQVFFALASTLVVLSGPASSVALAHEAAACGTTSKETLSKETLSKETPSKETLSSDGPWGYIKPSGEIAIERQFLKARDFCQGLAAVYTTVKYEDGSTSEKWGFIDKNGDMAIEPQFDDVGSFSDGLAAARLEKWGFIDTSGQFVIQPQFESAGCFSEGLAPVAKTHMTSGYIDKTGAWKIEPKFHIACQFSNNRAAVMNGDSSGSYSYRSSDDVYSVSGGSLSFVDRSGKVVIDSLFEGAGIFSQNLAPVAFGPKQGVNTPDKWGFLKPDGTLAIKPQFNAVHAPSEDLIAVQVGTWKDLGQNYRSWTPGKWGYVNLQGMQQIEPVYDGADRFSEGLAGIKLDGKWGFINRNGKMVIKPQFPACGEFHNGLAPVKFENQ